MKQFIEIWNAKDSWKKLSKEERGEYLNKIGPHVQGMLENGVEIISWGENNDKTSHRADYDFFAIWSFPSQEAVESFEQVVEGAGWYNYFDQVNLSGTATTVDEILGKLMEL